MRRTLETLSRACFFALTLACGALVLLPAQAHALTSTTITIDGMFDDWVPVRADPQNVAFDTQLPMDPDWPGQPDRDVFYVNATYDSEYLYLCWRRTAGGNKAITFGAYLDLDGDGLLQENRDVVVVWTVSDPSQPTPAAGDYDAVGRILHYYQARDSGGNLIYPEGDPMVHYGPPPTSMQDPLISLWRDYRHIIPNGDGNTPDGWAPGAPSYGESYPTEPMDAYMDPVSGIECEARVAWTDLGFTSGIPPVMSMHFTGGNGESFGSANKTSLWSTDFREVSGRAIESNRGQVEDNVRGLYWLSTTAVTVAPDNSAGGPAGSTLWYEHTVTNGGNGTDTFDLEALSSSGWEVHVYDASYNEITELTLAGYASATVWVSVSIPSGAGAGTTDLTTLTATSQRDSTVFDSATDISRVGQVTVTPDQSASTAPGQWVDYEFDVQNNMAGSRTYDLAATSTLGFTNAIYDELGNPITSVTIAEGDSATVRVRVWVPAGATLGSQDVTRLSATLEDDPTVYSSASATTTVADGIAIEPDNTGYGGAGAWVQYTHTVTNSWPDTRTVTLSYTTTEGWPVRIYASDGITEIAELTLGPDGASEDIIVRVYIPTDAAQGDTDSTTITATAPGSPADSATDTTIVRRLLTYADAGFINDADHFTLGDTVFARATGLTPRDDVYFVWLDSTGAEVRRSAILSVDTQGMAFDDYTTGDAEPTGVWTVLLYSADGTLLETSLFTVTFDAEITALSATNAPTVNSMVTVSSSVENHNSTPITDSSATYLIWWDSDGNGTFGAGDIYIDDAGTPHTWDGTSAIDYSYTNADIDVAAGATLTCPDWTMSNLEFPNQGTYNVTMTWTASDGTPIDTMTTQFYSVPTLGWPLTGMAVCLAGVLAWSWQKRTRIPRGGVRA